MALEKKDLAMMREEYGSRELHRSDLSPLPMAQFAEWFNEARDVELDEPNAMSVSTIGLNGFPTARTVLTKFFDENGLVFYTNYESAKAKEIEANPRVCCLFTWLPMERQVRIEGIAEKVSTAESLKYFATRPRHSQIGAWVSEQSKVVSSRSLLLAKFSEMKRKFSEGEVPLPDFWGGYRVRPTKVEFWQGGQGRLHDRFVYDQLEDQSWEIKRLAP